MPGQAEARWPRSGSRGRRWPPRRAARSATTRSVTQACAGPAYFKVLVSASCTTRNAVRSMPGAGRAAAPRRSRRPADPPPTSWSPDCRVPARPGCGVYDGAASSSEEPDQPAHLGHRVAAGLLDRHRGRRVHGPAPAVSTPAHRPAWTVMTDTEWAMMSCSSRAIRRRSSMTARRPRPPVPAPAAGPAPPPSAPAPPAAHQPAADPRDRRVADRRRTRCAQIAERLAPHRHDGGRPDDG